MQLPAGQDKGGMVRQNSDNFFGRYIIKLLIMGSIMLFVLLPTLRLTDVSRVHCDRYVISDGWDISINSREYKDVSLNNFYFDVVNKGDRLVYTNVIPDEAGGIERPVLVFYSIHAVVDIYLDDGLIYTYGHDIYEKGDMLGYGEQYIYLDDNY